MSLIGRRSDDLDHAGILQRPGQRECLVALKEQLNRLLVYRQNQKARLEHILTHYRAALVTSQEQGWGDAALLSRQIMNVRTQLEAKRSEPSIPLRSASPTTEEERWDLEASEQVAQRLLAFRQTQVARLGQRLALREAELAVSQELGLADCMLLTRQITALRAELERIDLVIAEDDHDGEPKVWDFPRDAQRAAPIP